MLGWIHGFPATAHPPRWRRGLPWAPVWRSSPDWPVPTPRIRRRNADDLTITAKDFRFSPNRIEVSRDDLLRLTVKSEDVAYGFTIDDYRVSKRVPAGGSVVLELRAGSRRYVPLLLEHDQRRPPPADARRAHRAAAIVSRTKAHGSRLRGQATTAQAFR